MTIEECYTAMGANYQDVLRRFYKPDMIRRFARMFLQDTSFQQLTDAMARQDVKDAFLAAHTLKGVCLNLGFSNLTPSAVALTEILRAGSFDGAAEQYALVEKEYHKTIEAINALGGHQRPRLSSGWSRGEPGLYFSDRLVLGKETSCDLVFVRSSVWC